MQEAHGKKDWRSAVGHLVIAAGLAVALTANLAGPATAAERGLVKIAVFDFELEDKSAGGGIIAQDVIDIENLKLSTQEARRMLSASGRYTIVDAGATPGEAVSAGGIRYCNGCEAPLARKLGAEQSMAGVFTRVNRTEYTLQIVVRDTRTGELVTNHFTGLRMGANYAWPRGVKWLMDNKILSAQQ